MYFKSFSTGVFLSFIFLAFPTLAYGASLNLSPATGTFNKSCNYAVDINLNTAGQNTDGTDAIIKFNPSQITVSSVTPGSIYPDYPTANPDNSKGTISISGLSSVSTPYNGSGKFATINLAVNSNASAGSQLQLTFDFDPNNKSKTTDSNVVQTATVVDILDSVTNGVYTIGSGSCAGGSSNVVSGGGTVVSDNVGTPSGNLDQIAGNGVKPGIVSSTFFLTIVGSILVILGIAGLALL